jgi:hypothetical protein
MSWTATFVASIGDSTDLTTYDSTDTNITFTAGKTYYCAVGTSDSAATEEVPAAVKTSDDSLIFTMITGSDIGIDSVASPDSKLTVWWAKPESTLTNKTLRVVANDGVVACTAVCISIDEATNATPYKAANVKRAAVDNTAAVSATPDALTDTGSLQIAACFTNDNSGNTVSGTNWSNVASALATTATPTSRCQIAVNTSGTASQITYTGDASDDRCVVAFEVEAPAAAGHPAGRRLGLAFSRNRLHGIEGVRLI